jgi:hypothetical protein
MFGAKRDFHNIMDAVTIRYESFFDNAPPDWDKVLIGPPDRVAWLKSKFQVRLKSKE